MKSNIQRSQPTQKPMTPILRPIKATYNPSGSEIKKWGTRLLELAKAVPTLNPTLKTYEVKEFKEKTDAWVSIMETNWAKAFTDVQQYLRKSKEAFVPKLKGKWLKTLGLMSDLLPMAVKAMRSKDWIPEPDAGEVDEEGTIHLQTYTDLAERLGWFKTHMFSMYHEMEKEAKRLEIAEAVKQHPKPKEELKKPSTKPSKWQKLDNEALTKIKEQLGKGKEEEATPEEIEDMLDLGFDPTKFKADKKQRLLAPDEKFGVVTYTVVITSGWIGKIAKAKLAGSPFNYKPERVGEYWFLREALLLGVLPKFDEVEKVQKLLKSLGRAVEVLNKMGFKIDEKSGNQMDEQGYVLDEDSGQRMTYDEYHSKFPHVAVHKGRIDKGYIKGVAKTKVRNPDWKVINDHVTPLPFPARHKGRLYWLMVPKNLKDLHIYEWGLAK